MIYTLWVKERIEGGVHTKFTILLFKSKIEKSIDKLRNRLEAGKVGYFSSMTKIILCTHVTIYVLDMKVEDISLEKYKKCLL